MRATRPSAQKRSPVKGWFMSPSTGVPSSSSPISVPHSGVPMMKARVPSIGIDHPLVAAGARGGRELLADDAVIGEVLRDGLANGALGGPVGGRDGIEAGCRRPCCVTASGLRK